jgi:hypothetical protein
MLKNETTGETTTYSLYPDSEEDGFPAAPGWDIRKNVKGDDPTRYDHKYSTPISPKQKNLLEREGARNVTWSPWTNCASWASDTFYKVTRIDVDADDWGGFETPRELIQGINDLNQRPNR